MKLYTMSNLWVASWQLLGLAGMSAPEHAHQRPKRAPEPRKHVHNLSGKTLTVSSGELLILKSRFGVGCVDLP
jgi:hypothetical protein